MMDFLGETPLKSPLIFDTHAHYDDDIFNEDRDILLSSFESNGVKKVITCGCDIESSIKAQKLSAKYNNIYFAAGYHPGNIKYNVDLKKIQEISQDNKCVAIGEIGLDYYWTQDNKPFQREIFIKQIELAKELGFPVIVHDREAHQDTINILKEYKPKGVVHSFSGSVEMAEEILKLGMYIGIGGVITFKNAKKLPDVVKIIPEDRLLLETDAPYLTPVPYRGKINHSAMIYFVAQEIAHLKNTNIENILKTTYTNGLNLFNIE